MVTAMPAAAPNAAMAAPPLPELSSPTAPMPIWRSQDSITAAPRSPEAAGRVEPLQLEMRAQSAQARSAMGVQPSPMETGASMTRGNAAR